MKKVLYIIILAVLPFLTRAQKSFQLEAPVPPQVLLQTQGKFVARDYIQLKPGFTTATGPVNFKIDENMVLDVEYQSAIDPSTRQIDKSLKVGSIPGKYAISPTGAATYSIPLLVSPGTAGMQPAISLVYNSQSGNGLLGLGWDLAGLSAITRVSQNIYTDGNNGGVNLSVTDKLALDGNRLVLKDGTYGLANSQYGTLTETFSVITAYETAGTGIKWFKVVTKDGKTIEYGNTNDSRVEANGSNEVLYWRVNKITDSNGNFMTFSYFENNGESYINKIDYTGNTYSGLAPYNSIEFFYERKSDQRSYYIGGASFSQTVALRSIKLKCENKTVKQYNFKYIEGTNTRLAEIIESNSANERLNSTAFTWRSEGTKSFVSLNSNWKWGDNYEMQYPSSECPRFIEDVDGDGRPDLVGFGRYGVYVALADGIDFGSPSKWISDYGWDSYGGDRKLNDWNNAMYLRYVADVNGDGKGEIVGFYKDGVYVSEKIKDSKYFSPKKAWLTGKFGYESSGGSWRVSKHPRYLADVNGDGMADVVGFYTSSVWVATSNGSGFNTPEEWTTGFGTDGGWDGSQYQRSLADVNGDGMTDIVAFGEAGVYVALSTGKNFSGSYPLFPYFGHSTTAGGWSAPDHLRFLKDVNGDGKADIVGFADHDVQVSFSTGNSFTTPIQGIADFGKKDDNWTNTFRPRKMADVNGDGRADIVGFRSDGVYVALSNGNTFDPKQLWINDFCSDKGYSEEELTPRDFSDINGDGSLELIGFVNNGVSIAKSDFRAQSHISQIQDGYNNKVVLTYNTLAKDSRFYNKGTESAYPVLNLQSSLKCVSKAEFSDGSSISYTYEGAKVHLKGLGFLGFSKTIATNNVLDRKTITTTSFNSTDYHVDNQTTQTFTVKDLAIDKTESQYSTIYQDSKYITNLDKLIESDLLNNKTVTSTYSYETVNDKYNGNVKSINKDYGDSFSEKTEFSDYTTLGKAKLVTVTKTHPDDLTNPFVSKTHFEYDSKGNITEKKDNYGVTDKEVTTSYTSYDYFGHHQTESITDGKVTYSNSYVYEPVKARYLSSVTKPLGTEKFQYEPAYGNLVVEEAINGNQTTYNYDAFGRLTRTNLPDGNTISNSTEWVNGDDSENALYYGYINAPGKPWSKTFYDKLGRVVRQESFSLKSSNVTIGTKTITKYNTKGQVESTTSYMGSDITDDVKYEYSTTDSRLIKETYLGGKTVSYTYGNNEITITSDSKETTKKFDNWGNVSSIIEPSGGGGVSYKYFSHGNPSSITAAGKTVSFTYDKVGNRETMSDPDIASSLSYRYDAFGRLTYQKDGNGKEYWMHYDVYGRMDYKYNVSNEKTSYEFYETGKQKGLIKKETAPNGTYMEYEYDAYGKLTKQKQHLDESATNDVVFEYSYDSYGNNNKIIYPGNYVIDNTYEYGFLTSVKNGSSALWTLAESSARKMRYSYGNGQVVEKTFDSYGLLSSIVSSGTSGLVQSNFFTFDPVSQMLKSREIRNSSYTLKEEFGYDDLYRLTSWEISKKSPPSAPFVKTATYSLSYKPLKDGNIDVKTGVGTYDYKDSRPHAIDKLTLDASSPVSQNDQSIGYTDFNKTSYVEENNKKVTFTYGPDQERTKMEFSEGGSLKYTMYYAGLYEKKVIKEGSTTEYFYVEGGDGLFLVNVRETAKSDVNYYIHKDHLGSIVALTKADGKLAAEYSYDPWGRRRNPSDWSFNNVSVSNIITRGFTGHEHLDDFALINMNGRMYDPALGLFLSPDNYVQAPETSQSFNRYSYCMGNPLMYTDPSGDFWLALLVNFAGNYAINWANNVINNNMSMGDAFTNTPLVFSYTYIPTVGGSNQQPGVYESGISPSYYKYWTGEYNKMNQPLTPISCNLIPNSGIHHSLNIASKSKASYSHVVQRRSKTTSDLTERAVANFSSNSKSNSNKEQEFSFDAELKTGSVYIKRTVTNTDGINKYEAYQTVTAHEGNSFFDLTLDNKGNLESVTINGNVSKVSLGMDGSILAGNEFIMVGANSKYYFILDLSVPVFGKYSSVGATVYLSKEPWREMGRYLRSLDWRFKPQHALSNPIFCPALAF